MFGWLSRNRSPQDRGSRRAVDAPPTPAERLDELLSAYLDDALTAAEQLELDARLAADPSARTALDGMRLVKDTLATLEVVPAPRSFAILAPPVPAARRGLGRFDLIARVGAMTAAVAIVAVLPGDFSSGGTPLSEATSISEVALSADRSAALPAGAAEAPNAAPAGDAAAASGAAPDSTPAPQTDLAAAASSGAAPTAEGTAEVTAASAEMNATQAPTPLAPGGAAAVDATGEDAGTDGDSPAADDATARNLESAPGGIGGGLEGTQAPAGTADSAVIDPPVAAPEAGSAAPSASKSDPTTDGATADAGSVASEYGSGTTDGDASLDQQSGETSATSANADEVGALSADDREASGLAIALGAVTASLAAVSGMLWWRRRNGTAGPV